MATERGLRTKNLFQNTRRLDQGLSSMNVRTETTKRPMMIMIPIVPVSFIESLQPVCQSLELNDSNEKNSKINPTANSFMAMKASPPRHKTANHPQVELQCQNLVGCFHRS